MKTLKKVLSLVLVVAMIASMLIVGAAAAEETNYPEAAAVVTNLGIIEGDEGGMRYGDNVTREQAAKILAYMLLGKDTAETLKTSAAPFADVAANRWSAGYIAFLKTKGVVSGVTDTEFDPTAPVTGVQLAKMLLTAVGYGVNGEFEGAAWDINTITYANETGLFEGTLADVAEAATREEAMLYAFNTLTSIPTVKYNGTFECYYTGTSPLQDNVVLANYTLGYLNYDLAKKPEGNDALGRPAATWAVDGVDIVAATATEVPVAVFSNTVTYAQLYAALGKAAALSLANPYVGSSYYIDGVPGQTFPTLTEASAADVYSTIGSIGATTELYVEYLGAGVYDVDIITYSEYYTTVKSVSAYGVVSLVNANGHTNLSTVATGFARKDAVLYTIDEDAAPGYEVVSLEKVAPSTGYHTASKTAYGVTTIVVDGTTYTLRAGLSAPAITYPYTAYDLYFDSYGNVVYYTVAAGVEITNFEYIYVRAAEANISNTLLTNANQVVVEVVYPTGKIEVLDLAVYDSAYGKYIMVNDAPVYLASITNVNTTIPEGWYTYTATEAGINLGNIAAASNYATTTDEIALTTGVASVAALGMIIDNSTVLTTIDTYGTATSVTGMYNIVSGTYGADANTSADEVLVTYEKDSLVIKTITVVQTDSVEAPQDLVYCAATGNTVLGGIEYTVVYKDGTVDTITVGNIQMVPGYIYTVQFNAATYTYDATAFTTGVVNAGTFYNTTHYVYEAEATIDTVAGNYFVTTEYTAEDVTDGIWYKTASPVTYYYDAYTVIVDCTGNGATTLAEGDIFVAATGRNFMSAFDGMPTYCNYIWIVG